MNAPPDSGRPVLEFDNVSHAYGGGIRALAGVSLTIAAGEAVALCGANGSGKTTLLKLAAGLLAPQEGRVLLAGEALGPAARRSAFRKVGFLFQDAEDQLFCPTVREDVAYGPRNLGLEAAEVRARVERALEILGVTHLADRPIHHLSSGEKKRVALAGLAAMQAPILVLDEPTSGLDNTSVQELITLLQRLNREHRYTLLVATHDIGRVPDFARRVLILRRGALYKDGSTESVLTDVPLLREAALEPPLISQYFHLIGAGQPIPLTLAEAVRRHAQLHKEGPHP